MGQESAGRGRESSSEPGWGGMGAQPPPEPPGIRVNSGNSSENKYKSEFKGVGKCLEAPGGIQGRWERTKNHPGHPQGPVPPSHHGVFGELSLPGMEKPWICCSEALLLELCFPLP